MIPLSPNESTIEPAGSSSAAKKDGIEAVLVGHERLRYLFSSYRHLIASDGESSMKLMVLKDIVCALLQQSEAKERVLYPVSLHRMPVDMHKASGRRILHDSLLSNNAALKGQLLYIDTHTPETPEEWAIFDRQVDILCTMQEMFMGKEEEECMLSTKQKEDLHNQWSTAVHLAPLHPHHVTGAVHPLAGFVDRASTATAGILERLHLKHPSVAGPEEVPVGATPLRKYEQHILNADDQPAAARKVATAVPPEFESLPFGEQLRTAWTHGLG